MGQLQKQLDELGLAMGPGLGKELFQMGLDGVFAQMKALGDLLQCLTMQQCLCYATFGGADPVETLQQCRVKVWHPGWIDDEGHGTGLCCPPEWRHIHGGHDLHQQVVCGR